MVEIGEISSQSILKLAHLITSYVDFSIFKEHGHTHINVNAKKDGTSGNTGQDA
jgi:hypothetical protein